MGTSRPLQTRCGTRSSRCPPWATGTDIPSPISAGSSGPGSSSSASSGFIPYIGSFHGTLLALIVAVNVGTTQDIVILLVWTLVFNIVQGSFIAPVVYGKAVNLHPAVVLIAIPAGGQLAGVMGMFLGVPILGIVAAIWRSLIAVMSDRATALAIQGSAGTAADSGIASPPDEPAPGPAPGAIPPDPPPASPPGSGAGPLVPGTDPA